MFINDSMERLVVTVRKEDSILDAQKKMKENGIRHLPVVDPQNRLIGIVTDRDIRSALPSIFSDPEIMADEKKKLPSIKVEKIMTTDVVTVSPMDTLPDALLLMEKTPVGAFPVVNGDGVLIGILSVRDLMRAFINVLGIRQPGTLLCLLVEERIGQMKKIVDIITGENISTGSILVARHWDKDKRAVFPYLLTNNVRRVKQKFKEAGFQLIDPMQWYLDQIPSRE